MLLFHPAFHLSSYILPRDPQERCRSNKPLNVRTCHFVLLLPEGWICVALTLKAVHPTELQEFRHLSFSLFFPSPPFLLFLTRLCLSVITSPGLQYAYFSRYSYWIWAGQYRIESRWVRNFPPVQTGPGAQPASCTMGTGSFPGVKCGRGVLLTTHPLLVQRSWKSRAIPLPIFWAIPGL